MSVSTRVKAHVIEIRERLGARYSTGWIVTRTQIRHNEVMGLVIPSLMAHLTNNIKTSKRTPPNSRIRQEGVRIATLEAEIARMKMQTATRNRGPNGPRRSAKQPRPSKVDGSRGTSTQVTNIPLGAAYTVRQSATGREIHRVRASEQIGTITMIPGQQIGKVVTFFLNPEEMPNTRLNQIAKNYQKFKFRRAALKIMSNLATAVSGQLVTGYTNSAEQTIDDGPNAPAEIYALPDAAFQSLYTPTTIIADIDQKAPALFIKNTGNDPNTTLQGQFFIGVSQQVTTAAEVTFPVLLDYDVELSGNAVQKTPGIAAQAMPSFTITGRSSGNMTLAIGSGETIPTFPSFPPGTLMQLNPSIEVELNDGTGKLGDGKLNFLSWYGTDQWRFFENVAAFNNGTPMLNVGKSSDPGSPNQDLPRTVLLPYSSGN